MLKRLMLLVSAAAAITAFAIPAAASAQGTIFHEGNPIATGQVVNLTATGFARFNIPDAASTYGCQVDAEISIESGHPSHGQTTFNINTAACEGTGLLKDCKLEADSTNAPFTIDVTSSNFLITNVEIVNQFDPNCIIPASQLTFPSVTATPNNKNAISSVTLSGAGIDDVTGLPIQAEGTLNVTPAGTYGIG